MGERDTSVPAEGYYGYQVTRKLESPREIPTVERDVFGRAPASPREISEAIYWASHKPSGRRR